MPSPFGHVLGGVAVVWGADLLDHRRSSPRFVAACGALATLPDVDLLFPGNHRMWSHSITAAVLTSIIAAAVTGQVTRRRVALEPFSPGRSHNRRSAVRAALVCGAAYLSHLVLDWLAVDTWPPYGLQILWPFSDRWFMSGWHVFRQTARDRLFTAAIMKQNVLAIAQEMAILLPIVVALWLVRVKTVTGLPAEATGGHHPAE